MRKIEDECVGCPTEMGCLGSTCPYKNVERFYCDKCGDEATLYKYDDGENSGEFCIECIKKMLDVIKESE